MMGEDPTMDEDPQDPMMEPDPMAMRPDLPMGEEDAFAAMACQLLADTPTGDPLLAVDTESAAGQVLLLPSETKAYAITLPEGGDGFLTMEVPDWGARIALYTGYETGYQVLGENAAVRVPVEWNPSCSDEGITHHRLEFHSWGAFTIHFDAEGPRQIKLAVIHTNPSSE